MVLSVQQGRAVLSKEQRVDPRVKRTRRQLEQSFLELLEEKGFQSTTVRDIADRATVNRATFYAHFEDKYALLDHVVHESFEQMLQSRLSPDSDYSLANLHLLILTVCEFLEQFNSQHRRSSAKQLGPLIEREVQSQVYDLVLRWIHQLHADGAERPATTEVTASAASWAIFGAAVHWSRNDGGHSAEETSSQVLSLLAPGLSGSPGVDRVDNAGSQDRRVESRPYEPQRDRNRQAILVRDIRRDRLKAATRPWRSDAKD